jgi:predicted DNA binding protein
MLLGDATLATAAKGGDHPRPGRISHAEIADMLDIAPNALALRLSRAKSALRKMLEEAA